MDGGGRLLRSLGALGTPFSPAPAAASTSFQLGGPNDPFAYAKPVRTTPFLPTRLWKRNRRLRSTLTRVLCSRVVGVGLGVGLLCTAGGYGLVRSGRYATFVAARGSLPDVLAKAAGFTIKAVTITGTRELKESEVLDVAGIGPQNSLVFVDVAAIRRRLKAIPLIKDASVTKLYPDRLLIEIEERTPYALWQKDGIVSIVAADGTPIDDMKDPRYEQLPLVVGNGANGRIAEYVGILDASKDLRDRVRAGILVADRRWTLKMDSGIEIALPERNPADAISRLAALEHDGHILEKDVTSLDLRIPGRVVARLSPDAAAAHAEAVARKSKKKGATT